MRQPPGAPRVAGAHPDHPCSEIIFRREPIGWSRRPLGRLSFVKAKAPGDRPGALRLNSAGEPGSPDLVVQTEPNRVVVIGILLPRHRVGAGRRRGGEVIARATEAVVQPFETRRPVAPYLAFDTGARDIAGEGIAEVRRRRIGGGVVAATGNQTARGKRGVDLAPRDA